MKAKMMNDYKISLKPENALEKCIIKLSEMMQYNKGNLEKYLKEMSIADKVYCKVVLVTLKMYIEREIPELPTVDMVGEIQ